MMRGIQLFFLLYIVVVAIIFALARKTGPPFLLPGDIYISKGTRIYIPLGASFIVTIILFAILWWALP